MDETDPFLAGRHAVITGAAGAIGQAIAERFHHAGATLTLIDIDEEALAFIDRLDSARHRRIVADLGSKQGMQKILDGKLLDCPVDVLVNSIGILNSEKSLETGLDLWRRVMAVNVESILGVTQAVVPSMIERRWGRLINLGSLAAKSGGITAGTAYSTSKAAVVGMTKSLAREYARFGITANVIAPAYVMSKMVSEQLSETERQSIREKIPVGRFCRPEEVAHAAAFLAHERAGFITGEVIDISGGLSLG